MNAYPFKELIKRWQTERLTTEQAIGQILLHLQALSMCKKFGVDPSLSLIYSMLFMHTENITYSELIALKFSKACANIIMKMRLLMDLQENQELLHSLKYIWLDEKSFVQYFVFSTLFVKDSKCIYDQTYPNNLYY